MATLARLVVKLVTDVTEFSSGLEKASKKLSAIGSSMSRVGDSMTLGVTLPLVAAGAAAVKFASDLEETKNKTQVVFGDMSQEVFAFADDSARAMGMSENAALSAAATFGNLFTSMGIGQGAAADMSTGLVQLAADLASFNNMNPEEVFLKLQSGIVGEIEPMRALGVNLSAAAVEAKAMQMGLADANGELSEQAKIMARYALIMEQTGNAQGDFARTSDGLANSSRILKAQLEDTLASFGDELVPAVTKFLQALTPILEFFNNLPDSVQTGIVYMGLFAAALGPILSIGGRLAQVVGWIAGLFGGGGVLSAALGGLSTFITSTVVPALTAMGAAIGAISLPVLALVAAIGALIAVIIIFGKDAVTNFVALAKLWVQILVAAFNRIIFEIRRWVNDFIANIRYLSKLTGSEWIAVGKAMVQGIWNGIQSGWQWLKDQVKALVAGLLGDTQTQLQAHSPSLVWARKIGLPIAQGIQVGFAQGMEALNFSAALQPSSAEAAPVNAVRSSGGSREISVGPITIYGDLSKSAKQRLREEMHGMFTDTLVGVLK